MILVFASCNPSKEKAGSNQATSKELKGELKISGAYALAPLMNLWAEKFMSLNPGLKIEINANGTGAGITDLTSGNSNLAMVSMNLTPEQEDNGLWQVAVSREAVIPIINRENPSANELIKKGVTRKELADIFSAKSNLTWGTLTGSNDKSPVNVYIRSDKSGAAGVWADYLEISLSKLKGIGMEGDTGLVKAIVMDKNGIGFCNAHFAFDPTSLKQLNGICVLPIDINGNKTIDNKENNYETAVKLHHAAYLGTFPSHLCRDLNLVCRGKPTDPNCIEFIKWVLTEGQITALQAGYCEIRGCDKDEVINALEAPQE